jgi:hypothetical protein
MALQPPVAVAPQRPFGSSIVADYPYWHIGTETAMFGRYTGAVYQAHFHAGLDFPAPLNTPIVAPEAGVVKYAGYAASGSAFDGGGNIVHIFIAGGMHVVSCHLNYPPAVKSGQTVKRGQRVGYVGHTGNAFGNHDHFAIFTTTASGASLFRNPAHYLPGGKYAGSSLIKPASASVQYVVVVGPGVRIRDCPKLTCAVYRTSTSTYLIGVKMVFGGWVQGGSYTVNGVVGSSWAKVRINGLWKYIARPLVKFV